jgi:probable rRNA maturation factor
MRIYIKNRQRRRKVNQQRITNLLKKALRFLKLDGAELSILFVNDSRMRALNRLHRGVDRTTDVISFPQFDGFPSPPGSGSEFMLGDIVINLHKAERQAKEYGVPFYDELKRLLIHGLLHLLGYDHEQGKEADRKMQRRAKQLSKNI